MKALEAYADTTSLYTSDTIAFHGSAATDDTAFTVEVWRKGATDKKMRSASGSAGPAPLPANWIETGCEWPRIYQFKIPASWRSGVYAARFIASGAVETVPFVVKRKTTSKRMRSRRHCCVRGTRATTADADHQRREQDPRRKQRARIIPLVRRSHSGECSKQNISIRNFCTSTGRSSATATPMKRSRNDCRPTSRPTAFQRHSSDSRRAMNACRPACSRFSATAESCRARQTSVPRSAKGSYVRDLLSRSTRPLPFDHMSIMRFGCSRL